MKIKYALCAMLACIASAVALGQTVSVNYNKSQEFFAVSHLHLG